MIHFLNFLSALSSVSLNDENHLQWGFSTWRFKPSHPDFDFIRDRSYLTAIGIHDSKVHYEYSHVQGPAMRQVVYKIHEKEMSKFRMIQPPSIVMYDSITKEWTFLTPEKNGE